MLLNEMTQILKASYLLKGDPILNLYKADLSIQHFRHAKLHHTVQMMKRTSL